MRLGSFTGQMVGNINTRHTHYYVLTRAICKRAGVNEKEKLRVEQYCQCVIFLHCYHDFSLGGLRKFTQINCEMEIIDTRGLLFRTAEIFLQNLPCCGVTYQYWHTSELINRRRSLNHADCWLTVTPSQCGDRNTHIYLTVVYRWILTVWQSIHTARTFHCTRARTHKHTHKITYQIQKPVHDQ